MSKTEPLFIVEPRPQWPQGGRCRVALVSWEQVDPGTLRFHLWTRTAPDLSVPWECGRRWSVAYENRLAAFLRAFGIVSPCQVEGLDPETLIGREAEADLRYRADATTGDLQPYFAELLPLPVQPPELAAAPGHTIPDWQRAWRGRVVDGSEVPAGVQL